MRLVLVSLYSRYNMPHRQGCTDLKDKAGRIDWLGFIIDRHTDHSITGATKNMIFIERWGWGWGKGW